MEFIRPCPPRSNELCSWVVGDTVEVFDHSSWGTATVCSVSDDGYFSARTRQSWNDGRWKAADCNKMQCTFIYTCGIGWYNVVIRKLCKCERQPDGETKWSRKVGVANTNNAEFSQDNDDNALVYIDSGLHESQDKIVKASFYDSNEADDEDCSVGSCSISSDGPNDAESFDTSRDEGNYFSTPEEGVAETIHRLELHAYRSTLNALYASGPFELGKRSIADPSSHQFTYIK
ncbi:uncharacterized protein [Rutidosis leptorrhynchoides]|uniref:uncharacterized protein n=1 Tax=Rutidosis leptorrhynchoides TaxID=125765 RepID=UPI003A9A2473